jgi:hypothetical protein
MLPISRFGRYGPLGPDDPDNSQPFISALRLLQEQGGLAPVQPSAVHDSSTFPAESDASTPPPPSPSVVIGWAPPSPSPQPSLDISTLTEVPPEELEALRALVPSPEQDAFRLSDAELREILDAIPNLSQEEAAAMFRVLGGIPTDRIQSHLLESIRTSVYGVLSSSDGGSHTPVQGPMEIDGSPGNLDNPITVSDSSQGEQAIDTRIASSFTATPVLPISDVLISAPAYTEGTRAHIASLLTEGGDYSQIALIDLQQEAVDAMMGATDKLNQAVEGYSHYFLEQPLHMHVTPTFAVAPKSLQRMVDIVTSVVSMGAHDDRDVEHGKVWCSLMPGLWYCLSFTFLSAILRGCIRTPRIAHHGRFDFLPSLDTFRFSAQLPMPETQHDALRFMAQQLLDHIEGPQGGPLLPHAAAMTVRDAAWQAQRELIKEEIRRAVLLIRERISTMALAEIIDQIESGDSVQEITRTLELELEEEAHAKFADRISQIKADTVAKLKEDARLEASDEARIRQDEWRFEYLAKHMADAEAAARQEQVKHFTAVYAGREDFKEQGKRAAKRTSDREYYDTLEECRKTNKALANKEIAAEIAEYKQQRRASLMLQADQEVSCKERERVRQAAVKLGLIHPLEPDDLAPVPKRSRREPRSRTASLVLSDARSRSASVSTVRKRGRSTSLDTPRQSSFQAQVEPSPCPLAGEEDTPMNSPNKSLTGSQIAQVKQELIEDDPLRGLRSSSHCPDNAMTDDSPSPKTQWPSAAHSRHATPAPDFTNLPPHFTPAPDMLPFEARIRGSDMVDDGPAPSDRTPTRELDPTKAAAHLISNTVRDEIDKRLNPITKQLNTLIDIVQRMSDKVYNKPTVAQAAPPTAAPAPTRKVPQNQRPSTLPVPLTPPVPGAPATHSQGVSETVYVAKHVPVTDATSEAPAAISPTLAVDAVEFPLIEETRLAIPSHRIKRNMENKAAKDRQWRQVPGATGPSHTPQDMPDITCVDGDDGHIPLRSSRIRPLFASIATQKVVMQHQKATTTGNQARAVQGRSKSGQRQAIPPNEQSVTYATVIRHGGLPNAEAERALHAKPPHFLVQVAQHALDRLLRFPTKILHGNWSTNYDQTHNFSYVLVGLISARDLIALESQLCEPFQDALICAPPCSG